jgi:hypothetical protein
MSKKIAGTNKIEKTHITRPGVHAKNGTSKLKSSKLYKKKNVGQGK